MANGYYEIKKAKDGQFYFNLKAGNGEVILTSEMYRSKASALNGIASVQINSSGSEQYEQKRNVREEPYFVLKAKNHQIIGVSESYKSIDSVQKGIASVMNNGKTTDIRDRVS
ncbi:YegP family protein [Candidatus Fukatsuia symbiotica]|uniref:DUF1508 domain-containing protein n=1 Tax=Candidatus Fukatsuia symbiotica TaxID=1878942 RepID=A0A2U8I2T0_9GAMM|nr:YegP family protein [Candidatus Fukatsuia symbiotica]AWK13410.1 hypothetical protein CCS41_01100 [Candidatus Fukatsuia symbiotica]MEA9444302.1 YegP family protein [Candidatus Fukatsuia symbiotica]